MKTLYLQQMTDSNLLYKLFLDKAVQLLAQRNHSSVELKHKLRQFYIRKRFDEQIEIDNNFIDEQLNNVIQYSIEHHWIDDIYYIEQYVKMRSRKGYGLVRIIGELKQRGLDVDLVNKVIKKENIDWCDLGLRQAQKKFHQLDRSNIQQKLKVFQFLAYRGFLQDDITKIYSLL